MAGGAQKKASARERRAAVIYGAITLAVNALFLYTHLRAGAAPLTRREWTGTLFLAGCYALSLFSLIPAAGMDVVPELSLDLFGLTVAVQAGVALWSPKAWYGLLAIPAYGLWYVVPLCRAGVTRAPGAGEAAAGGQSSAEAKAAAVMDAKRKRREEHRAGLRGGAMARQ